VIFNPGPGDPQLCTFYMSPLSDTPSWVCVPRTRSETHWCRQASSTSESYSVSALLISHHVCDSGTEKSKDLKTPAA